MELLSESKLDELYKKFEKYEHRLSMLEEKIYKEDSMPVWTKDLATKDDLKSFLEIILREIKFLREDTNKRFEELNSHMRIYFGLLTFVVTLVNTMITVIAILIVNKP